MEEEETKKHCDIDVVPDLCKETFISTKTSLAALWVLAGIILSGTGIAIGWSRTIDKDITEIKVNQNQLQEQVIDKLDYIIRKQEEK